jgi:hypothetical protein
VPRYRRTGEIEELAATQKALPGVELLNAKITLDAALVS